MLYCLELRKRRVRGKIMPSFAPRFSELRSLFFIFRTRIGPLIPALKSFLELDGELGLSASPDLEEIAEARRAIPG